MEYYLSILCVLLIVILRVLTSTTRLLSIIFLKKDLLKQIFGKATFIIFSLPWYKSSYADIHPDSFQIFNMSNQ